MRNYDGKEKSQAARARIEAKGYTMLFTTLYTDKGCPAEVMKASNGTGWETRKAIKVWAEKTGVSDYLILRATDYLRDLHGTRTYEVFVRNQEANT